MNFVLTAQVVTPSHKVACSNDISFGPSHRSHWRAGAFLIDGGSGWCELRVALVSADRALELPEPLTEGAPGAGETLGAKEHEGNNQDDEQVRGFKDAG